MILFMHLNQKIKNNFFLFKEFLTSPIQARKMPHKNQNDNCSQINMHLGFV